MTVIWIPLFHRPPDPGLLASNCKIDQLQITRFQWFTPKRLTKRGWRSGVTRPKWHHKRDNRYQTWSSDCSPCEFPGAWHSQRKPPCLMFAPGSWNVGESLVSQGSSIPHPILPYLTKACQTCKAPRWNSNNFRSLPAHEAPSPLAKDWYQMKVCRLPQLLLQCIICLSGWTYCQVSDHEQAWKG